MDWQAAGTTAAVWIWSHLVATATSLGLGGSGIGIIKYLRHMTPPKQGSTLWGSFYDTFQDLASNQSRIGQRRKPDGTVTAPNPITPTQAAESEAGKKVPDGTIEEQDKIPPPGL